MKTRNDNSDNRMMMTTEQNKATATNAETKTTVK